MIPGSESQGSAAFLLGVGREQDEPSHSGEKSSIHILSVSDVSV